MIFYMSDSVIINWIKPINYVSLVWLKDSEGEVFRNSLNQGLELVNKFNATKWISDTSKLVTINESDRRWVYDIWYPKVIKSGLKFMAIILPENLHSKESILTIVSKIGDLEIRNFKDMENAIKWIEKK